MQKANKFTYTIAALFAAVVFIISSLWGGGAAVVHAAISSNSVSRYTNVLDDLGTDESFNVADYPVISGDYSIQLKQIAESKNGELFLYVYHPCGQTKRFVATSVNISTAINDSLKYENYTLTLLNSSSTLYKYKVNDFKVKPDVVRYYDISSIYRKWDLTVDGELPNDNTASEKALSVGQLWTVSTSNGEVSYNMEEVEVITVTSQMVGFRRYSDGFQWSGIKNCDAHYLAFSCDHDIDKLLSADLQFYTQSYSKLEGQDLKLSDDKEKHSVTVHHYDKGASSKEEWSRMASVNEFFNEVEMTPEEKKTLSQYDWILNFYETEYERDFGGKDIVITLLVPGGFIWSIVNACTTSGTIVSDVTLMRLEFEYGGKIYNMGVVSDKQTGSFNPTNGGNGNKTLSLILGCVLVVVLVVVFFALFSKAKRGGNVVNIYSNDSDKYRKKKE